MSSAALISGSPFSTGMASYLRQSFQHRNGEHLGSPFSTGMAHGVASYAAAGSGGRGPVSLVLPPPLRASQGAIPHVVVLDTGVGGHPWFGAQAVNVGLQYIDPLHPADPPLWVGMDPLDSQVMATDPEGVGAIPDPMTGLLDSHAGHGTFIAGLLRQACADADITAVRVMDSDGVVPELMLTDAMTAVGIVQTDQKPYVDALVLSLGYYSESGDDVSYTAGLRPLVLALAARGVAIFCAAGNDSTQRAATRRHSPMTRHSWMGATCRWQVSPH